MTYEQQQQQQHQRQQRTVSIPNRRNDAYIDSLNHWPELTEEHYLQEQFERMPSIGSRIMNKRKRQSQLQRLQIKVRKLEANAEEKRKKTKIDELEERLDALEKERQSTLVGKQSTSSQPIESPPVLVPEMQSPAVPKVLPSQAPEVAPPFVPEVAPREPLEVAIVVAPPKGKRCVIC